MTKPSDEFIALQAALAGEYSLHRELGRGGMGVVYLAREVQLDRDVAIKVLPAQHAQSEAARQRFLREARTAAGLSHPHIVPIHRVGEAGGFVFFVMTYVDGETLGERLRDKGPLSASEAMRVLREVAWALAYAHRHGIVHRDVKPDNILLEAGSGRALVTDFGIAHAGTNASLTDPERVMGTAHFMSPEQIAGASVDGRSDIYALGVVGHLAVSGRLPVAGTQLPALADSHLHAETSVSLVAPGLPPALAAALDRCLSADPAKRFQDGEAMAAALAPVQDARPAMPPALRAWLSARNPLHSVYALWFTVTGGMTFLNIVFWDDILFMSAITALPLIPVVGFHINQARRQFRNGYTLDDLRSAIGITQRERLETETVVRSQPETTTQRVLRISTLGSAAWLASTLGIVGLTEDLVTSFVGIAPFLTTVLLGAASSAFDVKFVPLKVRKLFQSGLRDRLWNSRAGEWLAKRLGAPERSSAVGGGVFRPTEAALGVAASDLFAALPREYRDQLSDLPATVEALEARAAEARAEMEVVAALAPLGDDGAELLERRRAAASLQLAKSVAALEGIRLDLLRLHAGANDLAPLTTLLDAARLVRQDANRLVDAQREVEDAIAGNMIIPGPVLTPT